MIARHGLFCDALHRPGQRITSIRQGRRHGLQRAVRPRSGGPWPSSASSHIAAYSPEARGRSERAFRTLQDRLPKELGLAGIATVEAANRWIAETYLPAHNAGFAVAPEQPGTAFVPDRAGAWREILCIQEERQVGNDNTVRWRRLTLQIPPSRLRPHFVRATVRVHEYPDGALAVFLGPHRLADYDAAASISILVERPRDMWTKPTLRAGAAPGPKSKQAVRS